MPPFTLEQEKKRIKRERRRLGTKKRTCQVTGTLRPLPPPSTPFGFLRRPFPCLASHPRTSSRPLLFDDSFRYYYSPIERLLQPRSARFSITSSVQGLHHPIVSPSPTSRTKLGAKSFQFLYSVLSKRSPSRFSSFRTTREFYSIRKLCDYSSKFMPSSKIVVLFLSSKRNRAIDREAFVKD